MPSYLQQRNNYTFTAAISSKTKILFYMYIYLNLFIAFYSAILVGHLSLFIFAISFFIINNCPILKIMNKEKRINAKVTVLLMISHVFPPFFFHLRSCSEIFTLYCVTELHKTMFVHNHM